MQEGNFVINKMKAWQGSVAVSSFEGIVSPAYYVYEFTDEKIDKRFFHYLLRSCYKDEFRRLSGGIREEQWDLPSEELNNTLIVFPEIKKQEKIAAFLDVKCAEIDALSIDIQREIDILEEYKRSVITEKVTKGLSPDVEMKDSNIFYLGKVKYDWRLTKIGYVCTKLNRTFEHKDIALICSNKGKILARGENVVGIMASEDNAMQGIKKNDIAIHGMDTWHGAIALSEFEGKITRVVHVCDSTEDKRFIVYWLQYLAFQGVYKLISNGVRGNTSDFRSWDKVRNIYIALPDREEQKVICDYLDQMRFEIDAIIAIKKEQLTILDEYKKSVIYEYVTGKKEVI